MMTVTSLGLVLLVVLGVSMIDARPARGLSIRDVLSDEENEDSDIEPEMILDTEEDLGYDSPKVYQEEIVDKRRHAKSKEEKYVEALNNIIEEATVFAGGVANAVDKLVQGPISSADYLPIGRAKNEVELAVNLAKNRDKFVKSAAGTLKEVETEAAQTVAEDVKDLDKARPSENDKGKEKTAEVEAPKENVDKRRYAKSKEEKFAEALNNIIGEASIMAGGVANAFDKLVQGPISSGDYLPIGEANNVVELAVNLAKNRDKFVKGAAGALKDVETDTAQTLADKEEEINTARTGENDAGDPASSVVDKRSIAQEKRCPKDARALGKEKAVNKRLAKRDQDLVDRLAERLPLFPKEAVVELAEKLEDNAAAAGEELADDISETRANLIYKTLEAVKNLAKDKAEILQSLI